VQVGWCGGSKWGLPQKRLLCRKDAEAQGCREMPKRYTNPPDVANTRNQTPVVKHQF